MIRSRLRLAAFVVALLGATAASAACTITPLARLPVTMHGPQAIIAAKINGKDARFVADSGAFYSIVSSASAAEYGLSPRQAPPGFYLRGAGGDAGATIATVNTLTLAGVDIPKVQFLVGGSEVGGTGLLGQNILGIADAEYDFAGGMIQLMRESGCEKANLAYWAGDKPFSEIEINRTTATEPHIITTAYLNGVKIRALLDTGASSSIVSLAAAARAGLKPGDAGLVEAGQFSGLGRNMVASWIGAFASFKIGGEEIQKTRIRVGAIGAQNADMLLGADFFLSHRIYVAKFRNALFFTYNGGPIFNVGGRSRAVSASVDGSVDGRAAPTDAEGFSRRGAAFAARHELDLAMADLDKAIEMAPAEPRYYFMRATLRMQKRQPFLAIEDLNKVVALRPNDVEALLARAELKLVGNERPAAIADLDTATRVAAPQADLRLALGQLYGRAGAFAAAVAQEDLWLASHAQDSRRFAALNSRCWDRTLLGQDLARALADCNAALKLQPERPMILDSRALVRLKMGDFAGAIADYDAVIAKQPNDAWAIYARGVAKTRSGQADAGRADMAKAIAIAPRIAEVARQRGIAS